MWIVLRKYPLSGGGTKQSWCWDRTLAGTARRTRQKPLVHLHVEQHVWPWSLVPKRVQSRLQGRRGGAATGTTPAQRLHGLEVTAAAGLQGRRNEDIICHNARSSKEKSASHRGVSHPHTVGSWSRSERAPRLRTTERGSPTTFSIALEKHLGTSPRSLKDPAATPRHNRGWASSHPVSAARAKHPQKS